MTANKKGTTYWCSCVFHQEKTPSMAIYPDKDRFYCFGCHKSGDQIDLVAEVLQLSLFNTIQLLTKDLGLDGVISQEERDRIEREQLVRQRERQKKQDQQNTIRAEYIRLIDIEQLMYFFLSGIKSETDLERFEIIQSLRNKELLDYWLNLLQFGNEEEKLMVVEVSQGWNPWKCEFERSGG